jgi:hypothetical protein
MAKFMITKADVIAYEAGLVTDPDLRRAIEEARDTDRRVRHWFDLLDPDHEDAEVARDRPAATLVVERGGGYVSEHEVVWALAAEDRQGPPALDQTTALPSHQIDTGKKAVTLKYAADSIPLGVARVKVVRADEDHSELGSALVAFRTFPRGRDRVRVAEVPCDALGLSAKAPRLRVYLYVIPARTTNLSEFPPEQVRALRDLCNGDGDLRAAVEGLLRMLEARGG